jgi:hypothetical protein
MTHTRPRFWVWCFGVVAAAQKHEKNRRVACQQKKARQKKALAH